MTCRSRKPINLDSLPPALRPHVIIDPMITEIIQIRDRVTQLAKALEQGIRFRVELMQRPRTRRSWLAAQAAGENLMFRAAPVFRLLTG